MKSILFVRILIPIFLFSFVPFLLKAQANCSSAVTLTPSTTCTTTPGDLQGAGNEAPTGSCGGATNTTTYGVWYKFIASSSGATITVGGFSSPSNLVNTSTYIEVFSGICGSFTSIACQDVSSP